MGQPDLQMNIFGAEIPMDEVEQHAACTRDERCQAEADEHEPDCPVELRLKEYFGY